MDIERNQVWRMTKKAAMAIPPPPEGWPRVAEVRETIAALELALVVPDDGIYRAHGQRIQIPFSVLRRYYRRSG
jgi:hypothetical protein